MNFNAYLKSFIFLLKFKKKQQIFKQGDVDPYTYYLLDGEIDLEANGQLLKCSGRTSR